ncbi:hypothetical protein [Myxococcus sp. AB056]|uniref:hypothetical protein n=1 Tax=Myxococcaceae TaxID=31 RepID=UPI001890C60E|nr:hypothetical protein [Myxococcus sp. AB056]
MYIGTTAIYLGDEVPGHKQQEVRILAVHSRGHDVKASDRVEVARLLPDRTCSPTRVTVRADDLSCFFYLMDE